MTAADVSLCLLAVISSSAAQLCLKSAAIDRRLRVKIVLVGCSGLLMLLSVVIAVWILQTVRLSQLIPFAAGAYILVPLGGMIFFKETVQPKFWIGALFIMFGIVVTFLP